MANDSNRGILQERLFSVLGLAMATSPIVAGALTQRFGLRSLFSLLAVMAMIAAKLFWRTVWETHPQRAAKVL